MEAAERSHAGLLEAVEGAETRARDARAGLAEAESELAALAEAWRDAAVALGLDSETTAETLEGALSAWVGLPRPPHPGATTRPGSPPCARPWMISRLPCGN